MSAPSRTGWPVSRWAAGSLGVFRGVIGRGSTGRPQWTRRAHHAPVVPPATDLSERRTA